MSVTHHVSDALLADYESGALAEGWSLAVATHLALCPACRGRARLAASIGGTMLETLPPADVTAGALAGVFDRIGAAPPSTVVAASPVPQASTIPEPLRSYLGGSEIDALPWRRIGDTARDLRIPTGDGKTRARLLRVAAGTPVPEHGHRGMPELRDMPNVVMLPHMGSATVEGRLEMGEKVIINVKTFADGHRPPDLVVPSML